VRVEDHLSDRQPCWTALKMKNMTFCWSAIKVLEKVLFGLSPLRTWDDVAALGQEVVARARLTTTSPHTTITVIWPHMSAPA
jgi:hypothetical protein